MYKVSWAMAKDPFLVTFVLAPDVHAAYDIWHVLTGYGRKDGAAPTDIKVTNLDGHEVDMSLGLPVVAGMGTYARH